MKRFRDMLDGPNGLLWLCLAYYIVMSLVAPGFLSINNAYTLLFSFVPLAILALGQMLVMLTAGIDLSVTSIVALTSVAGGYIMSSDTTWFSDPLLATFFGLLAMLLVGGAIGLLHGLAVTKMRMPAFMVTLTSMLFFSGFAIWITRSQNLYNLPEALVNFPYVSLAGVPLVVIPATLLILGVYFFLHRSIYGEWIYAVGVSRPTAKISGVPVVKMLVLVYVLSGVCAALASMFFTARLETGSPVMGQNILLDVIGAVVIGGTSLFGGKGSVSGTLGGAMLMTLLDNSLNLLGLSFFLIMIGKGVVILITALINVKSQSEINHA